MNKKQTKKVGTDTGRHSSPVNEPLTTKAERTGNKTNQQSQPPQPGVQPTAPALITEAIKEEVAKVFALQPHIAQYMRGPNDEAPVIAEALIVCWQHETTTWWYGARPIVSPADLQANEARIRRALAGVPDEKAGVVLKFSKPFSVILDALNKDGIISTGAAEEDRLTKLLVATMCLLPPHDRKKIMTTSVKVDLGDAALWGLEVKGRPDLTQLKQHILKHGGERFTRNDHLAAEMHPEVVVKLLTEGRIFPRKGAKLFQMEMCECHGNALSLAARPGVELWTGFALHNNVWTLHSWVLDNDQIIETTWVPDLYYGFHFPTPFSKLVVALVRSRNLKADQKHGSTPGGGNRHSRTNGHRRHHHHPGRQEGVAESPDLGDRLQCRHSPLDATRESADPMTSPIPINNFHGTQQPDACHGH